MKNIFTILVVLVSIIGASAQAINWESNKEQRNFAYLNFGYDFGITTQTGFAYHLKTPRSIFLSTDVSTPLGEVSIDDFKYRLGGQMLALRRNKLLVSSKVTGVVRRHETELVRVVNIGVELSAIVGYHRSTWHIAGELGYENLLATQLKHGDRMIESYTDITGGWYRQAGGNFFFGIQGSKTLGKSLELNIRAGSVTAQFADVNPLLPYYAQLGLVLKIGRKE